MKAASRSLSATQALRAAMPFRSEPEDAAVAEVFGTRAVSVAETRTRSTAMSNSRATTCATLVNRPWPISVPPWFTSRLPSAYRCSSAPAWFRWTALNEMPNFTGTSARPRRTMPPPALAASTAARRAA